MPMTTTIYHKNDLFNINNINKVPSCHNNSNCTYNTNIKKTNKQFARTPNHSKTKNVSFAFQLNVAERLASEIQNYENSRDIRKIPSVISSSHSNSKKNKQQQHIITNEEYYENFLSKLKQDELFTDNKKIESISVLKKIPLKKRNSFTILIPNISKKISQHSVGISKIRDIPTGIVRMKNSRKVKGCKGAGSSIQESIDLTKDKDRKGDDRKISGLSNNLLNQLKLNDCDTENNCNDSNSKKKQNVNNVNDVNNDGIIVNNNNNNTIRNVNEGNNNNKGEITLNYNNIKRKSIFCCIPFKLHK